MRSSWVLLSLAWASAFQAPAPTRVAPPLRATAQEISALTGGVETVFTLEEVQKILPHRYPFALVDKVVAYEPGESAVGIKQITFNEPQFGGHFPDRPIMPGVMQIEALAQLAGVVCLQMEGAAPGAVFFFAGVDGVDRGAYAIVFNVTSTCLGRPSPGLRNSRRLPGAENGVVKVSADVRRMVPR